MRRNLLALLCVLLLSAPAAAQTPVDDCYGCVLGIWDEQELTNTAGSIAVGTPKDVYLGLRFDPAQRFDGSVGLEFSISGVVSPLLLMGFETPLPGGPPLNSPLAPTDTTGTGGMNIAWSACFQGSQALAKMTLLAVSEISDRVLQVKRKYPTSNPAWHTPIFTQCDGPAFTATRVTGGSYCLNPGPHCPIDAVEPSSWSSIKQLFR